MELNIQALPEEISVKVNERSCHALSNRAKINCIRRSSQHWVIGNPFVLPKNSVSSAKAPVHISEQ